MKILVLCTFLSVSASTAYAQFVLGGQLYVLHNTDQLRNGRDSATTSISLAPRLAYVSRNMWYGLAVGFSSNHSQVTHAGVHDREFSGSGVNLAAFVRRLYRLEDRLDIWLEGEVGVGFETIKSTFFQGPVSLFSYQAGLRPGILFSINRRLSLEAAFGQIQLGKSRLKIADPSDIKQTNHNMDVSLNTGIQFGINWQFPIKL